ncbi:MAG: AAA family ATPase [Roseivirga sp.]
MKKLPIGIQSIEKILSKGDYIYVDKTPFALQMIEGGAPHCFLSRPRRFGKSLFVSTLKEIFSGNKELFKGCVIYESNYDWQPHPVIHFDFSEILNESTQDLKDSLKRTLAVIAEEHQKKIDIPSAQEGLKYLIKALSREQRVIVLIDEYDSPLIDHLNKPELAEENRATLRNFYKVLKSQEEHIRFTFVTGITKFPQVSLFSGPNHLNDITMDAQYATMMGYTQEELVQYFNEQIQTIIKERNEQRAQTSEAAVLAEIKQWYNGYRFSEAASYVYNPFSTLQFLSKKKPQSYWYASGTPSFLMHEIAKRPQAALSLSAIATTESRLAAISKVEQIPLSTLMFQAGYLTIQAYDPEHRAYQLDFPNQEVREAFFDSLLEELTEVGPLEVSRAARQLRANLAAYELAAFVKAINVHFAKIPYHASSKAKEGFYQAIFLTYLELSGIRAQAEVVTSQGRIDVMCELEGAIYIFELKVNQPAAIAMEQAQVKEYSQRYTQLGKEILLMGISFSSEKRGIADWEGELQSAEGKVLRKFSPQARQEEGNQLI